MRLFLRLFFSNCIVLTCASHAALTAPVQAKVDQYKKQLQAWAADPVIVAAVKDANSKGSVGTVTNDTWPQLKDTDSPVKEILSTAASKYLRKIEEDKNLNKLLIRDLKGNFVAGSSKPTFFNSGDKPQFAAALRGAPWNAEDVNPDPTSQIPSVQISTPIYDGNKIVGVMNSAVSAE